MSGGAFLRTGAALAVVAACAGTAAWAAWPQLSEIAGFGSVNPLDRKMVIDFAAAPEDGNPWHFRPLAARMKLRLGETGIAFYEAENTTDQSLTGQAQYSVSPAAVDKYFVRIACFCTSKQALGPHEKIEMPVTFFVDPALAKDPALAHLKTITLSYTFHAAETPERQVAAVPAPAQPLN